MKTLGTLGIIGSSILLASAAHASGYISGACPSSSGSTPCIEVKMCDGSKKHFNGGHAGTMCVDDGWHGETGTEAAGSAPFSFSGPTIMTANILGSALNFDCTLTLDGYVKKFQGANGWKIAIKVTGGSVNPGDASCSNISLSGFPWFINDNLAHSGYDTCAGVDFNGPVPPNTYTGSVGEINVGYSFLGIPVSIASGAHIHDVIFDSSSAASFIFNKPLVVGPSDTPTAVTSLSGTLVVQSPVCDIDMKAVLP